MLRAGYQFGSGIGLAIDAGYLTVRQTVERRSASVQPVGLAPQAGTANDDVHLRGATLGASLALQRGDQFVWMGRLGIGALVGSWSDTRSGTFLTNTSPAGVTYSTPEATENGGVRYLYVNPEFRIGYRLGKSWIIDLGVQGFLLLGLSDATWSDVTPVAAGRCPNADTNICAGRGTYGSQPVLGKTLMLASPLLGVRYEL
jgi:hypothetical protein